MRALILFLITLFAGATMWYLGSTLSSDAIALSLGLVIGVGFITVPVMVITAVRESRPQQREFYWEERDPRPMVVREKTQPIVIVVQMHPAQTRGDEIVVWPSPSHSTELEVRR